MSRCGTLVLVCGWLKSLHRAGCGILGGYCLKSHRKNLTPPQASQFNIGLSGFSRRPVSGLHLPPSSTLGPFLPPYSRRPRSPAVVLDPPGSERSSDALILRTGPLCAASNHLRPHRIAKFVDKVSPLSTPFPKRHNATAPRPPMLFRTWDASFRGKCTAHRQS